MRPAHEVRVLLWVKENEGGSDVGKPFGFHELLRLVAGRDADALRIPGNRTKGSSFGLVQSLAQGFFIMRWEQDARECFSLAIGTWLQNGKEHSWPLFQATG